MDIVTRIKTFLSVNGIANSIFADTCDIPRPTVSQLLNGRNKKISNEVLDKIHIAYPSLSMMWLMFGEEPMMLEIGKNRNNIIEANDSLFGSTNGESNNKNDSDAAQDEPILSGLNEDKITSNIPIGGQSNMVSDALVALAKNMGKQNQSLQNDAKARKIVNIMVFYSDNSFESFVPNK